MPADGIVKVSGISDAVAQEIPTSATDPGEVLLGCKYMSGSEMIGAVTIDVAQAKPGESAQDYLAGDISGTKYNFGLGQDVSGIGDVAKFGTAKCAPGTCASLWLVQIRGGMVAHLSVTVAESSGAEAPIAELAKKLLAGVTAS